MRQLLLVILVTACSSSTKRDTADPATAAAIAGAQPAAAGTYSCFSYVGADSDGKRFGCARTADCPAYFDQVKTMKGLREQTACAAVASVWCYQLATADDPSGGDVCAPSPEDCATARDTASKAGQQVRSECAQR